MQASTTELGAVSGVNCEHSHTVTLHWLQCEILIASLVFYSFWATACKTVRPMLSDRCLSVCPVCLSVTFVHCGQTMGRIKMKLDTQEYRPRPTPHCPGDSVLDGDPPPCPHKGGGPGPAQFSAHFYCGQTAGLDASRIQDATWYGGIGLSPGDFVLDGDPAPYPKRGGAPPSFRPTSIVAKRLHRSRCHLVRR